MQACCCRAACHSPSGNGCPKPGHWAPIPAFRGGLPAWQRWPASTDGRRQQDARAAKEPSRMGTERACPSCDGMAHPLPTCFRDNTSGAMYAGVPTVDFGWESNTADCRGGAGQAACIRKASAAEDSRPPRGIRLAATNLRLLAGCNLAWYRRGQAPRAWRHPRPSAASPPLSSQNHRF